MKIGGKINTETGSSSAIQMCIEQLLSHFKRRIENIIKKNKEEL
jgi:hypothetical protein